MYVDLLRHFALFFLSFVIIPRTGYRRVYQKGVRQDARVKVALHRRQQLRIIRYTRTGVLRLLSPGQGMKKQAYQTKSCQILVTHDSAV